jgi:hypothetical protein
MITVPKIVLIILAAIAVWFALRWLNRAPPGIVRRSRPPHPQPQTHPAVEDLVACRRCGAYVASAARGCGKAGCPLPG